MGMSKSKHGNTYGEPLIRKIGYTFLTAEPRTFPYMSLIAASAALQRSFLRTVRKYTATVPAGNTQGASGSHGVPGLTSGWGSLHRAST